MIPRTIHQTSRSADIPAQWREYQARAIALHPGWEYRHWTDDSNLELVRRSAPHLLPLYLSLSKGIMKVDLIRYVYMSVYGGLYLDLDYELVKPFDLLDKALVVPRENDDEREPYLGNSILASEPRHPFWNDVLDELARGVHALGREPIEDEVAGISGPGLVTRTYLLHRSRYPELYFARREEFNPSMPRDPQAYATVVHSGRIYGIHHCDGSWRAKTVPQRILRKLAAIRSRFGPR